MQDAASEPVLSQASSLDQSSTADNPAPRTDLRLANELCGVYHKLLGAGFSETTLEGWAQLIDSSVPWSGRTSARDIAFDILRCRQVDASSSAVDGFVALGFSAVTSRHFARWIIESPFSCIQFALLHMHHYFDPTDVDFGPVGDDSFKNKDVYITKEVPGRAGFM